MDPLMKIPFGIWSLKKIHLGTEASDIEPVHDWLQARNVRANFDNENLCVSFGILGSWDSDYTADDLGLVDTATKAATVIDTRIIPFSSRMSCELQVCS